MEKQTVRVWDVWVRLFHWCLVAFFVVVYFFHREEFHSWLGYVIFALIIWRVLWGFVGSEYARFAAFIYSPKETLQYTLSALRLGHAREYLSHNPMGAMMVFALLSLLLVQTTLGTMLYAAQSLSGPLAGVVPTDWDEWLESAHEMLAQVLAVLVSAHVVGVIWATWWHRENYIRSMITGTKSAFKRRDHREPH